jgi:hypothetical protein
MTFYTVISFTGHYYNEIVHNTIELETVASLITKGLFRHQEQGGTFDDKLALLNNVKYWCSTARVILIYETDPSNKTCIHITGYEEFLFTKGVKPRSYSFETPIITHCTEQGLILGNLKKASIQEEPECTEQDSILGNPKKASIQEEPEESDTCCRIL